jgi:hypothetical protein
MLITPTTKPTIIISGSMIEVSDWIEASTFVTPLIECVPSHGHIFAEGHEALAGSYGIGNPILKRLLPG